MGGVVAAAAVVFFMVSFDRPCGKRAMFSNPCVSQSYGKGWTYRPGNGRHCWWPGSVLLYRDTGTCSHQHLVFSELKSTEFACSCESLPHVRSPVEHYKDKSCTLWIFFVCFYLLILPELGEPKGALVSMRTGGLASEARHVPTSSA